MRDVFLAIGHEGLFIACASAKGNHHCLLSCARSHCAQRGKRREHGCRGCPCRSTNEFSSATRDRMFDPSVGSQIAETRKFSQLLESGIAISSEGVHLLTAFELETSGFSSWPCFARAFIGLSSVSSASASSCFIFLTMARCSSASCFW